MKKILLFALLVCSQFVVYGQYEGPYDDPVAKQFAIQRANMNDGMYEYIKTGYYHEVYGPARPLDQERITNTILNARPQQNEVREKEGQDQNQQQTRPQRVGGIQFSNEIDPRYQPHKKSAEQILREQQKKAQDEARHQQWLEQRRRAAEKQARREKERMLREYKRKEEEYNRIRKEEARDADAIYQRNASFVNYNCNEGRENMYRYHVPGTEIKQSSYVVSPTTVDTLSAIPKTEYKINSSISMNGDEKVMSQTKNMQAAVDSEWEATMRNPEPACEEIIEVVPIGNGCGPANGKVEQKLARMGQHLDALLNYWNDPKNKKSVAQEEERLDSVCSYVHDSGYAKSKNELQRILTDIALFDGGGHIMSAFTLIFGRKAAKEARAAVAESKELAEQNPNISFDPEKQILRKVRKCGSQNDETR